MARYLGGYVSKVKMVMRENASDHNALLEIQELMDGVTWSPDTLEAIAEVLGAAGYRVRDNEEE